jgi:hypothetical protein
MDNEPEHKVSKRGRVGEGRPTKRTPEVVARIAEAVAIGGTPETLAAKVWPKAGAQETGW